MRHLLGKLLLIRITRDAGSAIKILLTFLPAKLYKRFHKDIWVICEDAQSARDNGYWFFRYVRERYPKKEAYYPIKSDSADYERVKPFGNLVEFGSFRHYFLWWAAAKFIGTTKYHGFPDERLLAGFFEYRLHRFQYIFLNHGFARGQSNIVDARLTNYQLLIAMSELEKTIIVKLNGQDPEKVKAIGFCRHDNLEDEAQDKSLILVMPTWRTWLDFRHERSKKKRKEILQKYLASDYYKKYKELLEDKGLIACLEERDLKLVFYLHGFAQAYVPYFSSPSKRVIIAKKEDYLVQDLLKKAAFLITDYSSVAFDYAYMKKPLCYFQFDAYEFEKEQYGQSEYFTYRQNGFGPVVDTVEGAREELLKACERGFAMEEKYRVRAQEFFPNFGKDHCERTYELVESL